MRKQLGIVVDKLDVSQLATTAIQGANKLLDTEPNISVSAFYSNWAVSNCSPLFGVFSQSELYGFSGTAIATTIKTAKTLLRTLGPTRKLFYVWDLEWFGLPNFNYLDLSSVYKNKDLELIVRSQYHYDILKDVWKEPKYIMNDFSYDKLREITYDS